MGRAELLGLVVVSTVIGGCAALRPELQHAEESFQQARYEDTQVWLHSLEPDVARLGLDARVKYYFLRGMTAFRLGDEVDARHYLVLAQQIGGEDSGALRSEWRLALTQAVDELAQ